MLKIIQKIFTQNKPDFKSLVSKGAVIIDVRSTAEFKNGHVKGAINIPLEKVKLKSNEIKKMNKPVITCCRSGMRSGQAASVLATAGIRVYNGGAWDSLQGKI